MQNPILHPDKKQHQSGEFSREEVALANRNSGTLLETLQHDITPLGAHYLLNHFDVPQVADIADWSVSVTGKVAKPITLNIPRLKQLAAKGNHEKSLRVTLECAGNGRANFSSRWPSQPWQMEAVGTCDWHGMPLKHLLNQAELHADTKEIVFTGADQGVDGGSVHHFARSLTLDMALHDDVMLVWQMNGQPLLPQHGFPLRLIVPGWYGMASVKWLNRIDAIDHEFTGHQQRGTYMYRESNNDSGVPVTTIRVKSLMVPPGIPDWSSRKRLIKPGLVTLNGRAWSGAGTPVSKVEVSCNDQWQEAELQVSPHPYAWCKWTAQVEMSKGMYTLSCRATDANGNIQPDTPPWDNAGFGNNAAHSVEVWCEDF